MKFLLADPFMDFITGKGIWILVGCLAFALLVSIIFLVLNIEKEKKARQNAANRQLKPRPQTQAPREKSEPIETKVVETPAAKEEKVEQPKVEAKAEPKKAEPAKEEKVEAEEKLEESGNYEIRYDAEAKQWVIRRENSLRATKRTRTKQEAIDYAKPLADKHEVKLIIHTKND